MSNEKETIINKRLLTITVVLAAIAAIAATGLLVNIFEHRQEAKNPFYKTVELSDKIDDPATWGKNFPMQYNLYLRTKQEAGDEVRRRRGAGAHGDAGGPAADGRALQPGQGPAAEDDVGGLRVLGGLPRAARARVHARRPGVHRAAEVRQAAGHVPELPRVAVQGIPGAGRGRHHQGLREDQQAAVRRGGASW